MKKNRWLLRAVTLLLITGVLMVTVSAVDAGSSGDPLVTLSYLQQTYLGQILAEVDAKLTQRNAQLTTEIDAKIADVSGSVSGEDGGTAQTFAVVTLTKGQILTGELGCEVMLRVGTAVCVADSNPGLVDETGGGTLAGGKELVKNHLYMMTIEGRGVKATADTVKLMVRGTYTVA
jgi:hypothetical protein